MKTSYGRVRKGSDAVRRAFADARSARNQATRRARELDQDAAVAARRQRRRIAKEDRDLARAMSRRVRLRVPQQDRPRGGNSTPRKLFNRQAATAFTPLYAPVGPKSDGLRSLHFSFTARGFASTSGRRWRAGEAGRAALYIVREDALEGDFWWSNVARDRTELLAFWRATEALERHDRKNANVYIMEIGALDSTLTRSERGEAVMAMTNDLTQRGLGYAVGLHRPDPSGDQRNFHVHIMYSLRPVVREDAYDWSFAAAKIADVNTPAGILARRRVAVDAVNMVLEEAGSDRRYTALSNRARGLVDAPQPKLGQNATWIARRIAKQEREVALLDRLGKAVADLQSGAALVERVANLGAAVRDRLEKANRAITQTSDTVRDSAAAIGEGMRSNLTRTYGQATAVVSKTLSQFESMREMVRTRMEATRLGAAIDALGAERIENAGRTVAMRQELQGRRQRELVGIANAIGTTDLVMPLGQRVRQALGAAETTLASATSDAAACVAVLQDDIRRRLAAQATSISRDSGARLDALARTVRERFAARELEQAARAARSSALNSAAPPVRSGNGPPPKPVQQIRSHLDHGRERQRDVMQTGQSAAPSAAPPTLAVAPLDEDDGLRLLAMVGQLFHSDWDPREYHRRKRERGKAREQNRSTSLTSTIEPTADADDLLMQQYLHRKGSGRSA